MRNKPTVSTEIPISFWGSPALAARVLEKLLQDSRFEVRYAVTQPDRPRSRRGRKVESSPVKKKARESQIPVFSPENLSEPSFQKTIGEIHVELHLVLAYGKLIPEIIFNKPPLGALNFHASLLPLLRGAAPIEFSLWESHLKTGWSLQQIVSRLDAGDIISQVSLDIEWEDHQSRLHEKMQKLLLGTAGDMIHAFSQGVQKPLPQNEEKATYCRKLTPTDGEINWEKPCIETRNQARALCEKPGVFCFYKSRKDQKEKLKLFFDFSVKKEMLLAEKYHDKLPGDFVVKKGRAGGKELWVVCGDRYALPVEFVQMSGKPKLGVFDFVNGYVNPGSITTLSE